MTLAVDDLILSQLADGELPHDETVATLLVVLENEDSRERLRQHLQLRQMSAAWRLQPPPNNLSSVLPESSATPRDTLSNLRLRSAGRRGNHVVVASLVGGLLVALGVWLGKSSPVGPETLPSAGGMQSFAVSPGQRQQIAQVFAFHESVAGPLKCFAADDKAIEMAPADAETQSARPLAVVLRLTAVGSTSAGSHEYVIVCRQGVPVAIPLPHGDVSFPQGRLYLSPVVDRNGVGLSYSLTMEDAGGKSAGAVIAGRRQVGNDSRSLGELAMGDRFVRVEASAWPLDGGAME